jgi:hypothetical protein
MMLFFNFIIDTFLLQRIIQRGGYFTKTDVRVTFTLGSPNFFAKSKASPC